MLGPLAAPIANPVLVSRRGFLPGHGQESSELQARTGPLLGGMLGTSSFEVTQNVVQLAGAYRAWDHKITPVDAVAGARYSYLKADLALSPSVVSPAGAGRASRALSA
jgi:hypothetical protein